MRIWLKFEIVCFNVILYCTRLTLIVTRRVSEGRNFCPRLRFGLLWNVSFLIACSIMGLTRCEKLRGRDPER